MQPRVATIGFRPKPDPNTTLRSNLQMFKTRNKLGRFELQSRANNTESLFQNELINTPLQSPQLRKNGYSVEKRSSLPSETKNIFLSTEQREQRPRDSQVSKRLENLFLSPIGVKEV